VFVALVAHHAMRMRHIVICGLPGFYDNFPHYLTNCRIFEKMLLNTKCVSWYSLQLLSETFLILRRIERDMIKNVYRPPCKAPVILVWIEWNLIFFDRFWKKYLKYQILWKSIQLEPICCMRTDGRTDITKLTVASRNCANAPKNIGGWYATRTLCFPPVYTYGNFTYHVRIWFLCLSRNYYHDIWEIPAIVDVLW